MDEKSEGALNIEFIESAFPRKCRCGGHLRYLRDGNETFVTCVSCTVTLSVPVDAELAEAAMAN